MNYQNIEKLEGWGSLSAENLNIQLIIKNISLDRFIYSLGIRHIGIENALISKYFKSFSKFKNLSKQDKFEDLLNIDGMGETQINSIKLFK